MNDLLELPRRRWVRVDEVARFIGCSTRHVRRMAEKGLFVAFCGGTGADERRFLRIERESVLKFVQHAVERYRYESGVDFDDSEEPADQ